MFGLSPLPRTIGAAQRDVEAPRRDVRLSALRDLARLAGGEDRDAALSALAKALAGDKEPAVRGEAAVALADAGGSEHVDALVRATRDDNLRVRQMALMALGEVAPPDHVRARAALERELGSDSPELRFQSLVSLHHISKDKLPALARAFDDEDAHIRHIAFRIAEERFGEPPPEVVQRAAKALDDPSFDVRLAAAILLSKHGDERGHACIAEAVAAPRRATEREDEQAAVELAGQLGIEAARAGLERRAFGALASYRGRFSWHARVALARMGDARARSAILRGLGSWTRDARTLAVAAAGDAALEEARPLIEAMRGDIQRADPDAVARALEALDRGAR